MSLLDSLTKIEDVLQSQPDDCKKKIFSDQNKMFMVLTATREY